MALLEISTPDGMMEAFGASPAGKPRGAVIVIQEAFGLTDHIGSIVDRLAAAGYRSVAPALFHRSSRPATVAGYDDYETVLPLMGELTAEGIETDLRATVALLRGEGFGIEATGMVGFCMGGAVTLFACTLGELAAGVTFYGGGVATGRFGLPSLIELAPHLTTAWLGLYGDLDESIPIDQVEALRAAAGDAGSATEIVRYADAGHGFNCNDRPAHYNAAAAADGWGRTIDFLGAHLQT